jgi:hypothetical protein
MAFAILGYLYCAESIANMQSTGSSSDSALWPRQRDPQFRIVKFAVKSQAELKRLPWLQSDQKACLRSQFSVTRFRYPLLAIQLAVAFGAATPQPFDSCWIAVLWSRRRYIHSQARITIFSSTNVVVAIFGMRRAVLNAADAPYRRA